ncbi:MAG: hypothetical protein HN478_22615 [Rhodospirillaceae bacterium]|jgi:hypothetical protein|nr:hypothetical protein [Rhodospirillaceae bacterium]
MKRILTVSFIVGYCLIFWWGGAAFGQTGEILRGEFKQQRKLQGLAKTFDSAGRFTLAGGRGLIWRVDSPFAVSTTITADGIMQEIDGAPRLKISSAQVPFLQNFRKILQASLSGRIDLLSDQFEVQKSQSENGEWRAVLTSDANKGARALPIVKLEIIGREEVRSVLLVRTNGDTDFIRFADHSRKSGPLSTAEEALLAAAEE